MRKLAACAALAATVGLVSALPATAGKANFQDISITSPGGAEQRLCVVVTPNGETHRVALQACDATTP